MDVLYVVIGVPSSWAKIKSEVKNMIDITLLRKNPEYFRIGALKKGVNIDVDEILKLDKELRDLQYEVDQLRARRKKASQEIASLKREGEENDKSQALKIKQQLSILEPRVAELQERLKQLLLSIPLPPAEDVPQGRDERDNVPVKTWGDIPHFDFPPKDYLTLMEELDLLDLKRGAKIGGFRQYVLKNEAVLLEQAILRWSIDFLLKKDFVLLRPTVLVNEMAMIGSGMFPKGKEETYQVDDNLFLTGTTEVPLMAYHAGEVLKEKDLPKKYVGYSSAFRREAGSYGKDTKGIFRVHEFIQTEQVILCKNDLQESVRWHEWLLANSEEMLQALKLPYRVVNVCSGELTDGQAKRYDIEVWVPSQQKYRETHSDSYLLDFQARRLNIRYRTAEGKLKFVHSLNNTGIATPRILIPLIEIYQQADGSIAIPEVLRPYLGFERIPKDR
jgi:seryl-tRNA synthetase